MHPLWGTPADPFSLASEKANHVGDPLTLSREYVLPSPTESAARSCCSLRWPGWRRPSSSGERAAWSECVEISGDDRAVGTRARRSARMACPGGLAHYHRHDGSRHTRPSSWRLSPAALVLFGLVALGVFVDMNLRTKWGWPRWPRSPPPPRYRQPSSWITPSIPIEPPARSSARATSSAAIVGSCRCRPRFGARLRQSPAPRRRLAGRRYGKRRLE